MTKTRVQRLYDRHIRELSQAERLRLLALLASDLARDAERGDQLERDIMELDGLGKEVWKGIDAQAYVERLRAGEPLP
jgi:hypothetical protein